jgi:hypothetical protein
MLTLDNWKWNVLVIGAETGQRGHCQTVLELVVSNLERGEEA